MTKFKLHHNFVILLSFCIFGCSNVTEFEISLPCTVPTEITEGRPPKDKNVNGCWMLVAEDGHGYLLDKPGSVSCSSGERCVVVVPDQSLWLVGLGVNKSVSYDVDCSETC